MKWIERCRCGRQVTITLIRSESPEKTSSKVMKHWYDKDGQLEKMTGNGIEEYPKDPPVGTMAH